MPAVCKKSNVKSIPKVKETGHELVEVKRKDQTLASPLRKKAKSNVVMVEAFVSYKEEDERYTLW